MNTKSIVTNEDKSRQGRRLRGFTLGFLEEAHKLMN